MCISQSCTISCLDYCQFHLTKIPKNLANHPKRSDATQAVSLADKFVFGIKSETPKVANLLRKIKVDGSVRLTGDEMEMINYNLHVKMSPTDYRRQPRRKHRGGGGVTLTLT